MPNALLGQGTPIPVSEENAQEVAKKLRKMFNGREVIIVISQLGLSPRVKVHQYISRVVIKRQLGVRYITFEHNNQDLANAVVTQDSRTSVDLGANMVTFKFYRGLAAERLDEPFNSEYLVVIFQD